MRTIPANHHRVFKCQPRPIARIRALRSFIVALIAFFGITLILIERLEHSAEFRDPIFGDKFRKLTTAMRERTDDRPILVLGSSRVDNGFRALDAETLGVVMNFGFAGGGPLLTTIYSDRLKAAGIFPKFVIIECLPSLLHHRLEGPAESVWFTADRFTHAERSRLRSIVGIDGSLTTATMTPWHDGRLALLGRFFPWLLETRQRQLMDPLTDRRGWNRYRVPPVDQAERNRLFERTRSEYGSVLADLRIDGPAAQAFTSLVYSWKKAAPVHILLMPESIAFRGLYGTLTESTLQRFLKSLAVPVIDARDWVPDQQFADGHHLLPDGATTFTNRLTREVWP